MIYSIPFKYTVLNEPVTRQVEAQLVFDLPQTSLVEAQKNLFVRDIVRYPYIADCYRQDAGYKQKPECILREYQGGVRTGCSQIRVVYQKEPNNDQWFEFVFHISLENDGSTSFMPFKEIRFTCRREYDIFYRAFCDDLLIAGVPTQVSPYEEGNLVKVSFGAVYELAIVDKDNNGQLVAHPINNSSSQMVINTQTLSCIHGFNLSPDLMMIMGARRMSAGYGIEGDWFELSLADAQNNSVVLIHIVKQDYRYFLVIDTNEAPYYRLEEFYGFDGMQRLIKQKMNVRYMPQPQTLRAIEMYIRQRHAEVYLLMQIPDYIAGFGKGTDAEIVIDAIQKQYSISRDYAIFLFYYCRPWS